MPKLVKQNKTTGKGKKVCPECNSIVGARTLVCTCGNEFKKNKKEVVGAQKKGRGKKTCPNCNKILGARTKECDCGHKFVINKQPSIFRKRRKSVKFKDLEVNDVVRIIQGSGPVWVTKSGEESPCGHSGKYHVTKLDSKGFFGRNVKSGGNDFVYMGREEPGVGSLVRRAHKLLLVKREKKENV